MENASKALIIAGAILLSILIIGLGMFIYQKAAGAMDTSSIDQTKVTAYNSPYEQYFGTDVSGPNLKALISAVNSHNLSTKGDDSLLIQVNDVSSSEGLTSLRSGIQAGKTYTVMAGDQDGKNAYDSSTGYLINIFYKAN